MTSHRPDAIPDPLHPDPPDLPAAAHPDRDSAPSTVSHETLVTPDPWRTLSHFTEARIALGRAGSSFPTQPLLQFAADHAMARDAIHSAFDIARLARSLDSIGLPTLIVHSEAATRADYLRRPDYGRRLDQLSRTALISAEPAPANRLCLIIADGLSPLAPVRNALPLLEHLRPGLTAWSLDVILAAQARVALADEIGHLRGAEASLILIGERPGLKSSDSLGAYLTYSPRPGRSNAERNCVSNIRDGGLSFAEAAARLLRLLADARSLQASGVCLKEGASSPQSSLPLTTHLSDSPAFSGHSSTSPGDAPWIDDSTP